MDELIAFLWAQLDEDERVARESVGKGFAAWSLHMDELNLNVSIRLPSGYNVIRPDGDLDPLDAEHIVRWDPERVLAEVEAKRRVLDRAEHELRTYVGPSSQVALAHLTIKQFAQPYAGRDGWREEWRA